MLIAASQSIASENGTGNYGVGVQTVAAGLLPPPGMTMFNGYVVYYTADSFRDDKGNSLIPGFQADLHVQALRAVHTWGTFKGVTLSSSLIFESIQIELEAAGQEDSDFGPTLIDVEPLHIGIKLGDWYLQTGTYFWIPLGSYDRTALANNSFGYATVSQSFAGSWLPTPQWELSLDANISFNFENKDTHYQSGDLYGLTYSLGYRPFVSNPKWQLGVNGFYVKQFNDDEIDGVKVPTGFRLQKFAVGPQVVYWFSQAVAVVFKWQNESSVRNAPDGDSFWLQAAFPLPL
ncbi:MAG: SphA family protein [Panacagrimonas sp.]